MCIFRGSRVVPIAMQEVMHYYMYDMEYTREQQCTAVNCCMGGMNMLHNSGVQSLLLLWD